MTGVPGVAVGAAVCDELGNAAEAPQTPAPSAVPAPVAVVRPTSAHTTDGRTAHEVVFYRLGQKFVDHERSIPEDVRSVLYYTLAIGHHTGVIDCLQPRLSTSRAVFADVLGLLESGEAYEKLAGIERFGEIELKKEHVGAVKPGILAALGRTGAVPREAVSAGEGAGAAVTALDAPSWLEEFLCLLDEIQCEPAVYAMGRRVTC